jgi:hypothetical protein
MPFSEDTRNMRGIIRAGPIRHDQGSLVFVIDRVRHRVHD